MAEQVQSLQNGNLIKSKTTTLLLLQLKHLSLSKLNSQLNHSNECYRHWEKGYRYLFLFEKRYRQSLGKARTSLLL